VLVFSAGIIGGAAAIYSAYFAAQTLKINLQRDKYKRSLELTKQLNGIELTKVRTLVIDDLSNPDIPKSQIHNKVISDKDVHDAVRIVLNHFEDR